MQRQIRLYTTIGCLVALFSCTKVINVNINNAESQLVIQGNITNVPGVTTVAISSTINYALDNIFPTVSGAVVKITDSTNGIISTLVETTAGTYQTSSLQGIQGHTYLLNVLVNGSTYKASSTMAIQVNLDSVTFQVNTGFGQTLINPMPNFQDPANINNYYKFVQTINSRITKKIFVFETA